MTALEILTPDPRSFDDTSRPFAEAVASHYAIKRVIGRGGMGIVYLARDKRLDRLVAIKTLPPQLANDASVRERFLRETRTAGGMSHPNIVPIHGADDIEGHVYFVMGFVEGESLAAHVRAHGQLPAKTVVRHLRDVASALAHAHGRGIIHRDIKAENILIERGSDRALVTDFGIARLAQAAPLTATGQLLGTVYYVSPEQVAGDAIDARSDIYSLGVVGYFALTGQFPFDAELASAVLVAHVTKPAPPVAQTNPGVPAVLATIIDRCLAKNPDERYASAEELLAALDAVVPELDRPQAVQRPRLISDTEAHSLWQRAAELQASTGIQPRPEPIPKPRDLSKDRSRTSGFKVDDVRSAASEAGISERYVQHALVEHGLASAKATRRSSNEHATPSTDTPPHGLLATFAMAAYGTPLEISSRTEVKGEIAPRDFDRLFMLLRDGTAQLGTTTASARELGWWCRWPGNRLEVYVVPDNGRTTIRVRQTMGRMAFGVMAASALGFALVGALAGAFSNGIMHLPVTRMFGNPFDLHHRNIFPVSVGIGVVVGLMFYPVGRAIFRWLHRQSRARLHVLAEALAGTVRDSIDADGDPSR